MRLERREVDVHLRSFVGREGPRELTGGAHAHTRGARVGRRDHGFNGNDQVSDGGAQRGDRRIRILENNLAHVAGDVRDRLGLLYLIRGARAGAEGKEHSGNDRGELDQLWKILCRTSRLQKRGECPRNDGQHHGEQRPVPARAQYRTQRRRRRRRRRERLAMR